jgi:NDP-sugar pyrophosphorylase family protein
VAVGYSSSRTVLTLAARVNIGLTGTTIRGCKTGYKAGYKVEGCKVGYRSIIGCKTSYGSGCKVVVAVVGCRVVYRVSCRVVSVIVLVLVALVPIRASILGRRLRSTVI